MFRNRVSLFPGLVAGAVVWMAFYPRVARPQDTSTPKPAQSQETPTTPSAAPATPQASPAPSSAQAPARAAKEADQKKAKKVWTNDEITSVKSGVSVVGDTDKGAAREPHSRGDAENDHESLHQQQVEECRNQIAELRDRIEAVDKRIAQLKDFKAENTSASGGIDMHQRYNMVPLADQVKQLEDAKKKLQAQIEDIENEARKAGIKPGELR